MYFAQIIVLYFYLISLCFFLNIFFKIKFQRTFLYSIILYSLILFLIFNLKYYELIFNFQYFIICIFLVILIFFRKEIKFNKFLLLFSIIYLAISIICLDKYFLDHDEFSYWGKYLKLFFEYDNLSDLSNDHYIKKIYPDESISLNDHSTYNKDLETFSEQVNFIKNDYHSSLVVLNQFLNMQISGYREDMAILLNNIILLASFLFILKDDFFIKKINIFLIFFFYALLNIFSFGFVSIYVDPILCSIFFVAINYTYENFLNSKINIKKILGLFLIILYLSLVHRSGQLYSLYTLFFLIYLIVDNNFPKYSKILIFLLIVSIPFAYELYNIENSFFIDFKLLANSYLYFSEFGIMIGYISEIFGINNLTNITYKINLYMWFLFLSFFFIISGRFTILSYFILVFLFHSFVILILKFYGLIPLKFLNDSTLIINNSIHHQHLPRYFSPILFAMFLFLILHDLKRLEKNFYYILTLFIFMILPLKAVGFFLPKSIYHIKKDNLEFYEIRKNLSIKAQKFKKNFDYSSYNNNIIIGSRKNFSDLISHNSLFEDIFLYEIYPLSYNYLYIDELEEFLEKYKIILSDQNYVFLNSNSFEEKKVLKKIINNK